MAASWVPSRRFIHTCLWIAMFELMLASFHEGCLKIHKGVCNPIVIASCEP